MLLRNGCFCGVILVHNNFVGVPNLSLLTVTSLHGVGGNMLLSKLRVHLPLIFLSLVHENHVAPWIRLFVDAPHGHVL